jgi:hypothetical protein
VPTEEQLDSEHWRLYESPGHIGREHMVEGTFDEVYVTALRARAADKPQSVICDPEVKHIVPLKDEEKLNLQSLQARKYTVELQLGGIKHVKAKGTFPQCRDVYEKMEKELDAGTLAFLTPGGDVITQKAKPMFRTTVTTPTDKDNIAVDQESYKRYLKGAEEPQDGPSEEPKAPAASAATPAPAQASEGGQPPAMPFPPWPSWPFLAAPARASEHVIPPAPAPAPAQAPADLLYEVQVLERVLVRERDAKIQLDASMRGSGQQMLHVEALLAGLRGKS